MKLAAQKSCPSFASIISILSIVFYCGGFLRVELELNKQRKRIDALETDTQVRPPPKGSDITKIPEKFPGKFHLVVKLALLTSKHKVEDGDFNNLHIYLVINSPKLAEIFHLHVTERQM